jgi:perosamine synthetase
MLSWWEPEFGDEEAAAVAEVVRSGYVNEGKRTAEFTGQVQQALGAKHVLATCNGTVALYLALRACGVRAGDEVIVPSLTFIATANAAAMCCATPVLADIRLSDLNIDPEWVERRITPRTKAIVAVHINGRAADMAALGDIARRHGIALVEDAAQALGSFTGGRALGTIGDAGSISLAPTKIITSGQGGLVLTERDDVRDAVVRLKDHGRLSRSWNYHPEIGYNFKYSDIYAAIAAVQFRRLDERLEKARRQFRTYRDGLADIERLHFVDTDMDDGAVPLWVDALADDAEALTAYLKERNIDCRPFWPAIHLQEPYKTAEDLPNTAYAARHGIWFPSGAGKEDKDIESVIGAVREFYKA